MAAIPTPRATRSKWIDESKPASIVINRFFGGLTRFCKMTGFATSTVHNWLVRGYIPAQLRDGTPVQTHILEIARQQRIKLPPSAFVESTGASAAAGG